MSYATKQAGSNNLFGDNLSSHFNRRVVELSQQPEIYFIMLPANGTYLMQPLDVVVFAGTKCIQDLGTHDWPVSKDSLSNVIEPIVEKSRICNSEQSHLGILSNGSVSIGSELTNFETPNFYSVR